MRFELSEDQLEIRSTVRAVFSDRASFDQLRLAVATGGHDRKLWSLACELGWPGIAVPEENGGSGLGCVELAVLLEEHGYHCAAIPLLGTSLAALALTHAADDALRAWLPKLADGSLTGTMGVAAAGPAADLLPDGAGADIAVLVDVSRRTARLTSRSEAEFEPVTAIDTTRGYARIAPDAAGEELTRDVAAAVDRALVATAAELLGLARRALDLTVAYAGERKQFGNPIGSYQAVSHTAADMMFQVEVARSAVYHAAWAADAGLPAVEVSVAASMAKAAATDAARMATAKAIQVHGAFGFSWEADVHWLYARAAMTAHLLGDAAHHRTRVALLVAGTRTADLRPVT